MSLAAITQGCLRNERSASGTSEQLAHLHRRVPMRPSSWWSAGKAVLHP
ncbi:hypothetical protein HMPREF0321_0551 [Dermacoccus sp. Ellin185]|nr:hypothetical protein HMPREF0321_0551 [Dermacoccus sp. Ellin185]